MSVDFSRNQLSMIPPFIAQLQALEVLHASNNKLVSLPEEIGRLKRLMDLVRLTLVCVSRALGRFLYHLAILEDPNLYNENPSVLDRWSLYWYMALCLWLPCEGFLTHLPILPHIWVSESGQHWFRWWLVAYWSPSHHLNQCCVIINWTLRDKLQWNFSQNTKNAKYTKLHLKISSVKWWPFCSGGEELSPVVWRPLASFACWSPWSRHVSPSY